MQRVKTHVNADDKRDCFFCFERTGEAQSGPGAARPLCGVAGGPCAAAADAGSGTADSKPPAFGGCALAVGLGDVVAAAAGASLPAGAACPLGGSAGGVAVAPNAGSRFRPLNGETGRPAGVVMSDMLWALSLKK